MVCVLIAYLSRFCTVHIYCMNNTINQHGNDSKMTLFAMGQYVDFYILPPVSHQRVANSYVMLVTCPTCSQFGNCFKSEASEPESHLDCTSRNTHCSDSESVRMCLAFFVSLASFYWHTMPIHHYSLVTQGGPFKFILSKPTCKWVHFYACKYNTLVAVVMVNKLAFCK